MKVVDAHVHLWDRRLNDYTWMDGHGFAEAMLPEHLPSPAPLDRRLLLVEVAADPGSALGEARWFSQLYQDHQQVAGFVAQVPFDANHQQTLATLADLPGWRGVRRLFQDDPEVYDHPYTEPALRLLDELDRPFDLCVRSEELPRATALVAAHPALAVVLDHCGKPPLTRPERWADWEASITELARHPQVHCKLSGLTAEAAGMDDVTSSALIRRALQHCLDSFGPERSLVGSDWPISPLLQQRAAAWFELIADLADPWVDQVLVDTATRVYRLDQP